MNNRIIPSRCFPFSCMHQQDELLTGGSERSVQEWGLSARHFAFLTLFLFHSAAKCPSTLASRQSSGSLNPRTNLCYKRWIVVWLLFHNLHFSLTLLTSSRFIFSVGNSKCCQLNTKGFDLLPTLSIYCSFIKLIYQEPAFIFFFLWICTKNPPAVIIHLPSQKPFVVCKTKLRKKV